MLTDTALAKLIVNWKAQAFHEVKGRTVVPYDSSLRVPMYRDLAETLIKDYGYTEEDLLSTMTKRMVIEASYNKSSDKAKILHELAEADWYRVIAEQFPMVVRTHDPSTIDTSKRYVAPPEPTPEELGPLVLSQSEFDSLTDILTKQYDKEFLVDMLVTHEKNVTPKQADRLKKIRIKAQNLQKLKDKEPAKQIAAEEEQEARESKLIEEKPLDRSIFEGLPPVVDPDDEDFLKELAAIGGDNE